MQNLQKDLDSVPVMLIASLTMIMATLMFLSFFLSIVPSAT